MNRGVTFNVVDEFERELEKFTGAPHAVAVSTGTAALFLALMYERNSVGTHRRILCPAKTFISVPMQILHAGFGLKLIDAEWSGSYPLAPTRVSDSALRFRRGMYTGGLDCISFHARKHLNIGEGGAVLTDDHQAADWLRAARNSGKKEPEFDVTAVYMLGWQSYMTPEKAARGLHLLSYLPGDLPDQVVEYPDLRQCPIFRRYT